MSVIHFDELRELRRAVGEDRAEALLAEAARRLATLPGAVVARTDHDSLAVVRVIHRRGQQADAGGRSIGEQEGHALRELLHEPVAVGALQVRPVTSVGVACVPDHGTRLNELLAAADSVLVTAAASASRVAVVAAAAALDMDALALHSELPAAIAGGQLRVFYQPLMAASSGRMVGVEALVRWQHPQRGLLGPGAFVPLAERSQTILPLTYWVLRSAVAQVAAWREQGHDIGVSVNIAPAVLADVSLLGVVESLISRYALPPSVLTLEVTEGALLDDPEAAGHMLTALRNVGARISIDDFGTGYTSLTMLRSLEVDELKIDRMFVACAPNVATDAAIVRALVDLAHRLSMEVVAEGVEDARTAEVMSRFGADVLQGFHFARPLPADELFAAMAPLPPVAPSRTAGPPADGAGQETAPEETAPEETAAEEQRLAVARRTLAYAESSQVFLSEVATLAATACGRPLASVSVVGAQTVSFVGRHGHEVMQSPRDGVPCAWAGVGADVFEVTDLRLDPRFMDGPAAGSGVVSYAGAPLLDSDGQVMGVLCVFGEQPGRLTSGQLSMLRGLAALAADHLQGMEVAAAVPRLHRLLEDMPTLAPADEVSDLCGAFADAAIDLVGADMVWVLESSPCDPTRWELIAQSGEEVDAAEVSFDLADRSGLARAVLTQRPVWIPDLGTSSVAHERNRDRYDVGATLVVPVLAAGNTTWMLSAIWHRPQPDLTPALRDGVVALAAHIGRQLVGTPEFAPV